MESVRDALADASASLLEPRVQLHHNVHHIAPLTLILHTKTKTRQHIVS